MNPLGHMVSLTSSMHSLGRGDAAAPQSIRAAPCVDVRAMI